MTDHFADAVDLEECRHIHRQLLRAARFPEFQRIDAADVALDRQVAALMAQKSELREQLVRLRQLPQDKAIDEAGDTDALKALWPGDLPNPYEEG